MKNLVFLLMLLFIGVGSSLQAQTWEELSEEQKLLKLKSYMEDNQRYMKETLQLSDDQIEDAQSVNLCFLNTLDIISTYGGSDADKKKYAKSSVKAREKQLQAVMGAEKFEKFQTYVAAKLQKAMAEMQ